MVFFTGKGVSNVVNKLPEMALNNTKSDVVDKKNTSINDPLTLISDREWAEKQAQKQMDFQKEMSSTSYQRAVEDLKKAGLNPALAYMQGGASTTSGASASTSSSAQYAEEKQKDRDLTSSEKTKDRTLSIFSKFIDMIGNIFG